MTKLIMLMLLAISGFVHQAAIAQQSFTPVVFIVPSHPNPGDPIVAHILRPLGGCTSDGTFEFSQNGSTLKVRNIVPAGAIADAGTCIDTYPIGALSSGLYLLIWEIVQPNGTLDFSKDFSVGVMSVAVPIPALNGASMPLLAAILVLLGMGSASVRTVETTGRKS